MSNQGKTGTLRFLLGFPFMLIGIAFAAVGLWFVQLGAWIEGQDNVGLGLSTPLEVPDMGDTDDE